MFGITHVGAFILASILIVMMPGPSTLLVLNSSINRGKLQGMMAAIGVFSADVVLIIIASMGIVSIFSISENIVLAVKLIGAAYIFYLGVQLWRNASAIQNGSGSTRQSKVFYEGFLTTIFNPKAVIFFMAFFPQYITLQNANVLLAAGVLAVLFLIIGACWLSVLVFFGHSVSAYIDNRPQIGVAIGRAVGAFLIFASANILFIL